MNRKLTDIEVKCLSLILDAYADPSPEDANEEDRRLAETAITAMEKMTDGNIVREEEMIDILAAQIHVYRIRRVNHIPLPSMPMDHYRIQTKELDLATELMNILDENMHIEVLEQHGEQLYFAQIIGAALYRSKKRKKILVIAGSSTACVYLTELFQSEFSSWLESLKVIRPKEIQSIDYSLYDIAFSFVGKMKNSSAYTFKEIIDDEDFLKIRKIIQNS